MAGAPTTSLGPTRRRGDTVDGDSDNALMSAAEVALVRELEACDVRLRLLNCMEGRARGDSLVRELQARRDEAEQQLGKIRSKGRITRRPPERSDAHVSLGGSSAPPPGAAAESGEHDGAPNTGPPTKARRPRHKTSAPSPATAPG
jgi:hypothetical protein